MSVIAPDAGRSTPGTLSRFLIGRPMALLLLGLALVALAPPLYLLQTGGALTTGYNIQRLQQERAAWIVKNEQLEAELAKARSLTWVEHEAVYRLGMQPTNQPTVVKMDVPPPRAVAAPRPVRESSMPMPMPTPDPVAADASVVDEIVALVTSLVQGR
jgi:hypothetical protein